MADQSNPRRLAIKGLSLKKAAIEVFSDLSVGGNITLSVKATASVEDEAEFVDDSHRFLINVQIEMAGHADGSDKTTFECACSAVGAFSPVDSEAGPLDPGEAEAQVNDLAAQVYLYARETAQFLTSHSGLNTELPLTLSLKKNNDA